MRATLAVLTFVAMNATADAQTPEERFARADRNGDGKLTKDELPNEALFRRLDRNGDGVIEKSEVAGLRRNLGTDGLKLPEEPAHKRHADIAYAKIKGVDPKLLSLDLYVPEAKAPEGGRPVLVMIHGGGWSAGDKANPSMRGGKMRHFVGKGYVYVSVNYRLSPRQLKDDGLKHPTHAEDCANAVAWVHDHVAEYGGDPDQIHLMGHSAGAHLAGIIGTNERFLKAHGKGLSVIKTNVLLDTAALDIPKYIELLGTRGRGMSQLYELAFGKDEKNLRDASPALHVEPGKSIPPTLIFYGGSRMYLDKLAPAFADSLTKAGSPSKAIDTVNLNHTQVNTHVGMIGDKMTPLIMRLHAGEDASKFPATLAEK